MRHVSLRRVTKAPMTVFAAPFFCAYGLTSRRALGVTGALRQPATHVAVAASGANPSGAPTAVNNLDVSVDDDPRCDPPPFACPHHEVQLQKLLTRRGFVRLRLETEARVASERHALQLVQVEKDRLDAAARAFPDRLALAGLLFLVAQTGLLYYWVYVRFDWNLVEPITYLLGYSVTWLGIAFYLLAGREFTYDNCRQIAEERQRAKLYAAAGFDVERYLQLRLSVAELERLARSLEKL